MKLSNIEKFMKDLNKCLREQQVPETLIINPSAAANYTLTFFNGLWRTTKAKPDFKKGLTVFGVSPIDCEGFATVHIFHAKQSNVSETELAWNEVAFNFPDTRWCYLEELMPMDFHVVDFAGFGIGDNENPTPLC